MGRGESRACVRVGRWGMRGHGEGVESACSLSIGVHAGKSSDYCNC